MTRLLVVILLGGILSIGLLSCNSRTTVATRPDTAVVVTSPAPAPRDSSMDGNLIARGGRFHWTEDYQPAVQEK